MPVPLTWQSDPGKLALTDTGLTIEASASTDLYIDPQGDREVLNAPCLAGRLKGDFLLRARIAVGFKTPYDGGALVLYRHERTWAKLCFEYSLQKNPMIVSVVTKGMSDDCNSVVIGGRPLWLRVARLGLAFAFHFSTDGAYWQLVRHFALDRTEDIGVGFLAQSPKGNGCAANFSEIQYIPERLHNLRTGE